MSLFETRPISDSPYRISQVRKKHPRHFQESWYTQFPSWLDYSPSDYAAYCLPCYLFTTKPVGWPGWDVFSVKGFKNWKKVNDGKRCAFLMHIGDDSFFITS